MTTKLCSKCGPVVGAKPLEAFNVGTALHGRAAYCRECMQEYNRRAREAKGAKPAGEYGRPLRPDELVVCPRCSLRGEHECIGSISTGLGGQPWV